MNSKTKIGIGIGLLFTALLGVAFYAKNKMKSASIKVAVEPVQNRTIVESVNTSGKIFPLQEVKVSPDISGEILELYVEEGDSVVKGQLLAKIDASLYTNNVTRANAQVNQSKAGVATAQAQVKQLATQLQQAQNTFSRSLQLYKEKVISAAEFEQAQTAFNSAKATIETAKTNISASNYTVESSVAGLSEANQNIKRANIYAPMSGVVSKLNVKRGERVVGTAQMAGTEMMRIADLSVMKVEVEIGENDIQKINLYDTALIEVDAYLKRKFKGSVTKIAQSNSGNVLAQAASSDQISNYTVTIEMDRASYFDLLQDRRKFPFRPGMSASVEILTKHHIDVMSVPINAITTRDLDTAKTKNKRKETAIENDDEIIKEYVFVANAKNEAELIEVQTDVQDNKYIEIKTGLKGNEKIIYAPYSAVANKLKNKDKITIVEKDALFEKEEEE